MVGRDRRRLVHRFRKAEMPVGLHPGDLPGGIDKIDLSGNSARCRFLRRIASARCRSGIPHDGNTLRMKHLFKVSLFGSIHSDLYFLVFFETLYQDLASKIFVTL
jgi:hypothetical protein